MILFRDYSYYGPEGKGPEAEVARTLAAMDEKPTTFAEWVAKSKFPALA